MSAINNIMARMGGKPKAYRKPSFNDRHTSGCLVGNTGGFTFIDSREKFTAMQQIALNKQLMPSQTAEINIPAIEQPTNQATLNIKVIWAIALLTASRFGIILTIKAGCAHTSKALTMPRKILYPVSQVG